jgi:glutamate carboxypeptidase
MQNRGATVAAVPQERAGDHLIGRWGRGAGGVLLLCHMDTVWDLGTLAERPVRVTDGRLYGPGAYDMKGGIVIGLAAVAALRQTDSLPPRRITLLITSDEELGSDTSRALIEAEAREHEAVLVLEPAHPPHGALKTWRKGVGEYKLGVTGRAAHAGAAHQAGVNAIEELARQVLVIQGLTDYAAGTTVNVGVVHGGSRSNVVPDRALADIDVRVMNMAEAARIDTALRSLRPHHPAATLKLAGGLNRPPMERTPATVALFAKAAGIAAALDFTVTETGTGGGSDGNFTAGLGIPTLDGLGATGDGAHALDEHVILASLPERGALLACLLLDC